MSDSTRKNITIEEMENVNGGNAPVAKVTNFDSKNYLNVRLDLDKGETSKELRIRLLTIDKDHNNPFARIKMHNVKVPKDISKSGFKSYVCLSQTDDIDHEKFGSDCPFCEFAKNAWTKYHEAKKNGDEVNEARYKDIAKANMPNEVGIIRCIERGHEEDGPKFWKFTIRTDKSDPLNTIVKLYKTRLEESREEGLGDLNILDLDKGKDLKVIITAVKDKVTGKPTNKTSVEIIDYGAVKPLTDDEELRDKWVNDPKVWSDVFVPKTYEYLSILMDGETPWYDREKGKWVRKADVVKPNNAQEVPEYVETGAPEDVIFAPKTEEEETLPF